MDLSILKPGSCAHGILDETSVMAHNCSGCRHPESTRKTTLERWARSLGLQCPFSFRALMSTESQLLVWKSEGLPADDLSQARGPA